MWGRSVWQQIFPSDLIPAHMLILNQCWWLRITCARLNKYSCCHLKRKSIHQLIAPSSGIVGGEFIVRRSRVVAVLSSYGTDVISVLPSCRVLVEMWSNAFQMAFRDVIRLISTINITFVANGLHNNCIRHRGLMDVKFLKFRHHITTRNIRNLYFFVLSWIYR